MESKDSNKNRVRTEFGSMETSIETYGGVIQEEWLQPRVVLSVRRGTGVSDGRKCGGLRAGKGA